MVTGTAIDSLTGKPVSFATVSLTADSTATPIAAVVTDNDGRFTLPVKAPGTYTLHVSFTGYTAASRDVSLNDAEPSLQLGGIRMTPGVTTETVTVTAQRPLVTADIDKITYNTESDPETPTLSAIEMLRKVPMLTVDGDDNLQMRGQSNFKILVNGKTSTLMSKNYKDVLKSMPAGSIKSIEVITNPPSKYDAEGIAGIINIITVRKTNNGYNGSLSAGADQFGGFNGSAYIAAAVGKFNLSANYFGGTYRRPSSTGDTYTENYFNDTYHYQTSHSRNKNRGNNNGLSLEASYEIDTFNLITLSGWGYLGNGSYDGFTDNYTYDLENTLTRSFRNVQHGHYHYGSISGNIDYQRTFRKPDRTFTVSYKVDYSPNNTDFENRIEEPFNYTPYSQRSDNRAHGGEHTFQVDYFDPITAKHQIEAGLKYILRPNTSKTENEHLDQLTGEWTPDDARRNDLDYRQHIVAAYAGYLFKLKKFSVKAGLRGEYTINDGKVILAAGDTRIDHDYFDLIPYATLSFKPTDRQNISLGYTQRLSRPGIWYLNPYVNDQDPLNVSTGNPRLDSEVSHSFNLNYGRYGKTLNFNLNVSASLTHNSIEEVSTVLPNGGRFTTYDNIGRAQYYGLYGWMGLRLLDQKLNFNLNVGTGYRIIDANNGSGLHNEGWNANASLNVDSRPWKNGNIYAYCGTYYSGVSLESSSNLYYYYSLGVSQYFLDRKLQLSVNATNPFQNSQRYTHESFNADFYRKSEYLNRSRSFRLSVRWRFGKMQTQVKKARRSIQNDDMKSGGGTAGGGGMAQ